MSFTQDVKRELAAIVPAASHCGRAQLSGLLFAAGTFEIASGGQYTVRVSSALPAVARSVLMLLRPSCAPRTLRRPGCATRWCSATIPAICRY